MLHYFIIILMNNYCPNIVNIVQLSIKELSVQFSWTICGYSPTPDFVCMNNLLYSTKHTQLSTSVKYMHINITNTIHILYSYSYLSRVSNIFTHKHVVIQCLFLLIVLIETHIKIHREDKSFKCNKVGMMKYEYLMMAIHTGEKPFKCNNCGVVKYGGRHITMHTGEKSFKYNKCGMVKHDYLHITMDTRKKLFKYNKCGMGKCAIMLMTIHMGEKPIKCNKCGIVKYKTKHKASYIYKEYYVRIHIYSWDCIGNYLYTILILKWR